MLSCAHSRHRSTARDGWLLIPPLLRRRRSILSSNVASKVISARGKRSCVSTGARCTTSRTSSSGARTKPKTFDRRANFSTCVISVSRNLCIDHYRSMRREHDVVTHDVDVGSLARPSALASPHVALERRDRVAVLRAALDKLAPSLRTAVILRDIQELSYQEIAEKLGVPEGTVKSRINRGRTELAREIARLREQQENVRTKGARRVPTRPRTGASR